MCIYFYIEWILWNHGEIMQRKTCLFYWYCQREWNCTCTSHWRNINVWKRSTILPRLLRLFIGMSSSSVERQLSGLLVGFRKETYVLASCSFVGKFLFVCQNKCCYPNRRRIFLPIFQTGNITLLAELIAYW